MLLLPVLLLAGCSSAPSPPPDAAVPAQVETAEYVIGPGDRLTIFVYDNPQLSTDVPVRPDGRISTPLVSDVVAAGQTPAQLTTVLTERLQTYVKEPLVTVIVRDFFGPFDRQIRVIGEAADPQAIAYREHMTVLDVMIITKGLTRFAAGNSAVIVRSVPGQPPARVKVRLADLIKDGDTSQNIEMRPGDTLIIPQTWF
jgi:polysaccharide export outer membrane protein